MSDDKGCVLGPDKYHNGLDVVSMESGAWSVVGGVRCLYLIRFIG